MENDELRAIVREEVQNGVEPRVKPLEARVGRLEHRTEGLETKHDKHAEMLAQQASAMTTIANVAAGAAENAGRALRAFEASKDDNAKMVTQALAIHKSAITDDVRASMSEALKPLTEEVHKIKNTSTATKTETSAQSTELTTQTSMLDELKKSKRVDRLLIILAGLASLVTWVLSTHH